MIMKMKKTICGYFEGDVTTSKKTLWLILALVFATGVIYGLRMAPLTHGVRIGCDNVSQNDCTFGKDYKEDEEEDK